MPITEYKIVVRTTVEGLTAGVIDDGFVPIGDLDPTTADYAMQASGRGTVDIGTVSDFQVVLGGNPSELEREVNNRLSDGLQPVGGVFHWHRGFMQAMGKITPNEGGGGGSGSGDLPSGNAFQVLGFDANKDLKAMHSCMAQWLGEDREIGGNASDFVPVVYLRGRGQKVSTGAPNLLGLSSSALASTVAARDSGGILSGATATDPTHLPNLKQVQEMIANSASDLEDRIFDILNNGGSK